MITSYTYEEYFFYELFDLINAGKNCETIQDKINLSEAIDYEDGCGNSALHRVAESGRTDIIKLLINNHHKVNSKNNAGDTPLHIAARSGELETVIALLNHGASFKARNLNDEPPIYVALQNDNPPILQTLLNADKRKTYLEVIELKSNSLLHVAVINETVKNVELLLKNKAYDFDLTNSANSTALEIAFNQVKFDYKDDSAKLPSKNLQMIELMLEYGAPIRSKILNTIDWHNESLLEPIFKLVNKVINDENINEKQKMSIKYIFSYSKESKEFFENYVKYRDEKKLESLNNDMLQKLKFNDNDKKIDEDFIKILTNITDLSMDTDEDYITQKMKFSNNDKAEQNDTTDFSLSSEMNQAHIHDDNGSDQLLGLDNNPEATDSHNV